MRRKKAVPPFVIAIDDDGIDLRRVQSFAFRRRNGPALEGGGVPLGKRLARRNQRHARDDGVQQSDRRVSAGPRWSPANPNPPQSRLAPRQESPPPTPSLPLGNSRFLRQNRDTTPRVLLWRVYQ